MTKGWVVVVCCTGADESGLDERTVTVCTVSDVGCCEVDGCAGSSVEQYDDESGLDEQYLCSRYAASFASPTILVLRDSRTLLHVGGGRWVFSHVLRASLRQSEILL